jgi:hypothetical protein
MSVTGKMTSEKRLRPERGARSPSEQVINADAVNLKKLKQRWKPGA